MTLILPALLFTAMTSLRDLRQSLSPDRFFVLSLSVVDPGGQGAGGCAATQQLVHRHHHFRELLTRNGSVAVHVVEPESPAEPLVHGAAEQRR